MAPLGDDADLTTRDPLSEHMEETEPPPVKPLRSPYQPTQQEWEEHQINHLSFRNWCQSCVAGRGKADAHAAMEPEDKAVPSICCDYCFMGKKLDVEVVEVETVPIIVRRGGTDRWITSHPVTRKGDDPWVVNSVANDCCHGATNLIRR